MSSGKQILALLRSRAEGDDESFFSVALQIAASEARQGHKRIAQELRDAVSEARSRTKEKSGNNSVSIPFSKPRGDLEGLLENRDTRFSLKDVVLHKNLHSHISDFLRQQKKRDWLREYGKSPNNTLLFVGPPGSGKTMCAEALADELKLPFFLIRFEALITRYMGETSAKLKIIFDEISKKRGVYLFDEFDAIGAHRLASNDVAEMRRVLNSFLQFVEEPIATDSVVICATNYASLLDKALLRRYDLILEFLKPDCGQIKKLIEANTGIVKLKNIDWDTVTSTAQNLSQSEIVRACDDAVKTAILDEDMLLETGHLVAQIKKRHEMKNTFNKSE